MELPQYVIDFLQTNYYIPMEQLNLPFDRMPASLRNLILTQCLNAEKGALTPKSEEEIYKQARKRFQADIDSDTKPLARSTVDNFAKNHQVLIGLTGLAERQAPQNDFSRTAILLAAKRMASDEYAQTPKTLTNFMAIRREVETELEIKYYAARYFDARPQQPENDADYHRRTIGDIAEIAHMVRGGKQADIAGRFGLPDSESDRADFKGATLSFAGAELRTFSDALEKRVKDSPFVRRVRDLDASFKQKYPKTYIAAKLVGNTAAAMTLGRVFSAYKAVAGINAMRKDFAEYKRGDATEKKSLWDFVRSPKGRQKLMEIGQNTLRVIPGMRAVGIALGAVKNSDNLRNSVKELRDGGGSKSAWLKVGGAAIGLLTVSAVAAYANDDVANAVNDCISHSFGAAKDAVEQTVDSVSAHFAPQTASTPTVRLDDLLAKINAQNATGAGFGVDGAAATDVDVSPTGNTNITYNDGKTSFATMHIDKDGKITFNGSLNQAADRTQSGATLTTANFDTKSMNVHAAVTDNQSGTRLVVDNNSAGQKVGIVSEDGCKNVDVLNEKGKGANVYAHADKVELKDGTVLRNNSVDLRAGHAATQINHTDGGQTGIRIDKDSANISHNKDLSYNQMHVGKDGISFNGSINQIADKTKDGVTVTTVNYDTKSMNVHAAVTDNQSGTRLVVDNNSAGQKVGIVSEDGCKNVDVLNEKGKGANIYAHADKVELKDGTVLRNNSVDLRAGHAATQINHTDGGQTGIRIDKDSANISHNKDLSYNQMHVGKDGISFNGSINQIADKTKDGVTVTTVNYDTKSMNVHAAVTDNQSGTRLVVDNNSAGQKVGVVSEDGCKNVDVLNEKGKGANIYAHADKVELKDGTVLRNNSVDLRAGHAATQINHTDGGQTGIRVDKGTLNVSHNKDLSYNQMHVGKDGISFNGSINQIADKTKDGVTVTTVNYDTKSMNVHAAITDNQSGTRGVLDNNSSGQKVSVVSENGCRNVDVLNEKGKGANVYAHADKVELKDGTVLRNNSVDIRAGHAATQINHNDGSQTGVRLDKNSANISHNKGGVSNQMHIDKNGKVTFNGMVTQSADPTKKGVTITALNYDTKNMNVHAAITQNQSGNTVVIDRNSSGIGIRSQDDRGQTKFGITIGRDGVNIRGKNGKTVNVGKVLKMLKGLTR